jgi:pullulanase-type alpha-1,6-glucosidase
MPDRFVIHVPGDAQQYPDAASISIASAGSDGASASAYGVDDYGWFGIVDLPSDPAPWTVTVSSDVDRTWDVEAQPASNEWWLTADGRVAPTAGLARGYYRIHTQTAQSVDSVVVDGSTTLSVAGSDDYGPYFDFPVTDSTRKFLVQLRSSGSNVGASTKLDARKFGHAWFSDAFTGARTSRAWADGYAVIHYNRSGGDYDGWGMHLWDGYRNDAAQGDPTVTWGNAFPALPNEDVWGLTFRVPLADSAKKMAWIIHKGNDKSVGADQFLDLIQTGAEVWYSQGDTDQDGNAAFAAPLIPGVDADLTRARAIWLDRSLIAWPYDATESSSYYLANAANGGITVDDEGIHGADKIRELSYDFALPSSYIEAQPYLSNYNSLNVDTSSAEVRSMLKGQVVVVEVNSGNGVPVRATGIQIGSVLDDVSGYDGALGVQWSGSTPSVNVWAPTAKQVDLLLYSNAATSQVSPVPMTNDPETGVWSVTGPATWKNKFYKFRVKVFVPSVGSVVNNESTDPYSIALSTNSTRSQIANLNDGVAKPKGWDAMVKPKLGGIADSSIYELHVRDFSVADTTVPAGTRGTYGAFTVKNSDGMRHLATLARAGLTHVHLLPVFDFATVNEDKSTWLAPDSDYLKALSPDSDGQQAEVDSVRGEDGYNWGYDPYHFTTPEGSYAKSPNGVGRTKEFRAMVQGLASAGLRTVMDVVYNHTNAAGQGEKSTFDKIVPGYYYRLNTDGTIANSTCCSNTATERLMMGKFVRDSLRTWAVDYKVDGFRFDIMGHMPKSLLEQIRGDMDSLTVAKDGVDGSKILLYGEGWNFGEVANDARFVQATQMNLQRTGVGTFDDRVRDVVRGGGPFDQDPRAQGFGSGLCVFPNSSGLDSVDGCSSAFMMTDAVKVALSGELASSNDDYPSFSFTDVTGSDTWGFLVNYNGQPAGYTGEPTEAVEYVDSHDDTTLFDNLAFKLPEKANAATRVRAQIVSLSVPFLSQGIPFVVAGTDMLRSKSLDKNSYDSGDWFNAIDWSGKTNGFGKGLPMYGDNNSRWDVAATTLQNPKAYVKPVDIKAASDRFQDLLRIRYSSPLFRLGSAANIADRLKFPQGGEDQKPGVIAMQMLSQTDGLDTLDPKYKSVFVLFNATNKTATGTIDSLSDRNYTLHPVQARGADPTVKKATMVAGTYSVPAWTTAVFVER